MKSKKEQIYDFLKLHASAAEGSGLNTQYLSEALGILRTNASRLLNELVDEGLVTKTSSRPVLYRLKSQENARSDQCFENLIGVNGSLQRPIKIAKAAVIYPEKSLNTLIIGEPGTGKSFMAMIIHQYAVAAGVIPENAPYLAYNCKEYQGNEDGLMNELFGEHGTGGVYFENARGTLLIDNVHLLDSGTRNKICNIVEQSQHHGKKPSGKQLPMVIVTCVILKKTACEDFTKKIPIIIELPALSDRPVEERMALIQSFFTLEAARAKMNLMINAELLRCLLLYHCTLNIKQLKSDIKRACAIAYSRELTAKGGCLTLFMSDFEPYVRKGFLNYQENREKIEEIIPADYDYTFSESTMKMSAIDRAKLESTNMYDEIDRRAETFLRRGMSDDEIGILLNAEFDRIFRKYWRGVSQQVVNKEQLEKLVDVRTIELVETFLAEVSARLMEYFPPSVFYGLCLHVDSITKGKSSREMLSNRQIFDLVEKNKEKYALSLEFISKIEKTFSISLPIEEAFLITMFLCFEDPMLETSQRPVVLFTMLGNGVAAALADLVNQLVKQNNTFYFDVPFDHQPAETYQALFDVVKKIERGRGIIALYDMDLFRNYFETIELETGIKIRTVHMPLTLNGVEWARKAAVADDVDTLYRGIIQNLHQKQKPLKRVIVTLCSTGSGGAEELKNYIEQYGDTHNMRVVPMAMADREQLREKLQSLQKQALIHCIIGATDPGLYGIPFLSLSEVLAAEPAALPEILRFKDHEKKRIDFDEVFNYLDEQLKFVNTKKLHKMLPPVIEQINREITQMSLDTEIGLLMHIACTINRFLGKETLPQNLHKEQVLKDNNDSYKQLLKILKPLERSLGILFTDDEMANIIMILKEI